MRRYKNHTAKLVGNVLFLHHFFCQGYDVTVFVSLNRKLTLLAFESPLPIENGRKSSDLHVVLIVLYGERINQHGHQD